MSNTLNHIKILCFAAMLVVGVICGNDLVGQSLVKGFEDVPRLEQVEDLDIKVFPNPSTDFVKVSTGTKFKGSFKLNNLFGKILLEGKIDNEVKNIDLLKYRTGIYIISIYDSTGQKIGTRKIIKN